MTKTYGIPYTGSKSGIAEEILNVLPNGKRFVDLFGGDIVYCDIPYELSSNKTCYGGGFNHKKFKQWANSQPFPIFVSSYIDTRIIWQKTKRCLKAGSKNIFRQECLYQYGGF